MSDTSDEPSETTRLMSADRAQPQSPRRDGEGRAQTTVEENGEVNLRVGNYSRGTGQHVLFSEEYIWLYAHVDLRFLF